jgi:hypothetical protein
MFTRLHTKETTSQKRTRDEAMEETDEKPTKFIKLSSPTTMDDNTMQHYLSQKQEIIDNALDVAAHMVVVTNPRYYSNETLTVQPIPEKIKNAEFKDDDSLLFFIPTEEDEKQDGEEISDDEQEQSNFVENGNTNRDALLRLFGLLPPIDDDSDDSDIDIEDDEREGRDEPVLLSLIELLMLARHENEPEEKDIDHIVIEKERFAHLIRLLDIMVTRLNSLKMTVPPKKFTVLCRTLPRVIMDTEEWGNIHQEPVEIYEEDGEYEDECVDLIYKDAEYTTDKIEKQDRMNYVEAMLPTLERWPRDTENCLQVRPFSDYDLQDVLDVNMHCLVRRGGARHYHKSIMVSIKANLTKFVTMVMDKVMQQKDDQDPLKENIVTTREMTQALSDLGYEYYGTDDIDPKIAVSKCDALRSPVLINKQLSNDYYVVFQSEGSTYAVPKILLEHRSPTLYAAIDSDIIDFDTLGQPEIANTKEHSTDNYQLDDDKESGQSDDDKEERPSYPVVQREPIPAALAFFRTLELGYVRDKLDQTAAGNLLQQFPIHSIPLSSTIDTDSCDITLVVVNDDQKSLIKVHSFILCKCEYFEVLLRIGSQFSDFAEGQFDMTESISNTEALKCVLRYIYDGECDQEIDPDTAMDMIEFANMLQLESLVDSCIHCLETNIDESNVDRIKNIAELLERNSLLAAIERFHGTEQINFDEQSEEGDEEKIKITIPQRFSDDERIRDSCEFWNNYYVNAEIYEKVDENYDPSVFDCECSIPTDTEAEEPICTYCANEDYCSWCSGYLTQDCMNSVKECRNCGNWYDHNVEYSANCEHHCDDVRKDDSTTETEKEPMYKILYGAQT